MATRKDSQEPDIITIKQAAKLLGVSRSTLYGRLEAAGRPGVKMSTSDPGDAQG